MELIEKLQNIPTSILNFIFLILVAGPILFPIGLPLTVDYMTKAAYDTIEALPEGSVVLIDYCVGPSNVLGVGAGAMALAYQALERNINVIFISADSVGPMYVDMQIVPLAEKLKKVYGTDWVHLGFYAGGEIGIAAYLADFDSTYASDNYGTPISGLPLMQRVQNHEQIDLLVYVGGGAEMPPTYLRQANTPYGIQIIIIGQSVTASLAMPYFPDQIRGIVTDLRGSAEYELLVNFPGEALATMDSLSFAYLWFLLLILLSNLGYLKFIQSKKGSEK